MQAGADANARDGQGHTPLDAAAGEEDCDIVELLLARTLPYIDKWTVDGILAHAKANLGTASSTSTAKQVSSINLDSNIANHTVWQ